MGERRGFTWGVDRHRGCFRGWEVFFIFREFVGLGAPFCAEVNLVLGVLSESSEEGVDEVLIGVGVGQDEGNEEEVVVEVHVVVRRYLGLAGLDEEVFAR